MIIMIEMTMIEMMMRHNTKVVMRISVFLQYPRFIHLLVEVCCLVFNKLETLIFAARPVILFIATVPSLMSVHVSWNSTNNNTGVKILDYRVMLIDTVTQEERNFSKITALSLYINNLKHNRTYLIKVQAENDDGYGRFKIKAFKTLEAG